MKRLIVSFLLIFISAYAIADTQVFKILENDPNAYSEEFFILKTNKGNLGIYMEMTEDKSDLFLNLKKGDCISLTVDGKLEKNDGDYFIENVKKVRKVQCAK